MEEGLVRKHANLNFGDCDACLLVNLGTPASYAPRDVKSFLDEFLSDPLVVDLPRFFWLPLLRYIILPLRSKTSGELYKSIWDKEGSPLLVITKKLVQQLKDTSPNINKEKKILYDYAMRYGGPSVHEKLLQLKNQGARHIKVIPLFPQYSLTTTESILREVQCFASADEHKNLKLETLRSFCDDPAYIESIANEIFSLFLEDPEQHIVFSFHGIPIRYVEKKGDDYLKECLQTMAFLIKAVRPKNWTMSFQSQFGPEEWLGPSTEDVVIELAKKKKKVLLCAPGFVTECLETLEELDCGLFELYENLEGPGIKRARCVNNFIKGT